MDTALYKMHCEQNGFVLKWKYLSSRSLAVSLYTPRSSTPAPPPSPHTERWEASLATCAAPGNQN